ncbi:MAG TPA: STN domain-containing protein [Paraburkholderia sp.]|jgi:hypothetical protein
MAGTRALASVSVLAACLGSCLLAGQGAHADDTRQPAGSASDNTVHFDVPAQPLSDALNAYDHLTGRMVIAPSRFMEGRTSAALQGDYPPREALERLLGGTGLQATFTAPDEAIILPAPQTSQPAAQQPEQPVESFAVPASAIDGVTAGGDYRAYAALIQTRLTDALCATPLTRPGTYRLAAQLVIGATGAVTASRMLESTGEPIRDAAIERAMASMVLDIPPPPTLPSPVTILLRPQGAGVNTDCAGFTGQAAP